MSGPTFRHAPEKRVIRILTGFVVAVVEATTVVMATCVELSAVGFVVVVGIFLNVANLDKVKNKESAQLYFLFDKLT